MQMADETIRSSGGFTLVGRLTLAAAFAAAVWALAAAPAVAQNQMGRQGQGPGPRPQQQAQPEEAELEQIELSASQVDAFITTENEIRPLTAKLKPNAQPGKQLMAQMEGVVKKNGFKNFDEYGDVGSNIGFLFSGINPETKKYEPGELIKKEIEAVNGNAKIPAPQKKRILADLQQAQKSMPAVKYPGNVDLVAKNYDRLKPLMDDGPQQPQQAPPPRPQQPRR